MIVRTIFKAALRAGSVAAVAAAITTSAQATILTFDHSNGYNAVYAPDYGNRVSATTMGNYSYGVGAEGFTPNVQISYGGGTGTAAPASWTSGYGDLTNVLFNSSSANNSKMLGITFTADEGFEVDLFGFDLAGWPNQDYTINGVSLTDELGIVLYSMTNVLVEGDNAGPRHTSFDFASNPLQGKSLTLLINMANLSDTDYDNIGIDNIRFGQRRLQAEPQPVPEPAALGLLGLGFACLGFARRRKAA